MQEDHGHRPGTVKWRAGIHSVLWLIGLLWAGQVGMLAEVEEQSVLVVVGAPGEEEYGGQFRSWAEKWREAAAVAGAGFCSVGLDESGTTSDLATLEGKLTEWAREATAPAWLVFIGHGTYAGGEAKFNLRGPDLTATELGAWLQKVERPLAIIQCASASAPFLSVLSRTNRVVITSTQSGDEQNFARFGEYISEAIADTTADVDKDGQTSLLEAFLVSARRVADFYEMEGRLATEHALLDDNGDRLGTPADWFEGIRATKRAASGALPDGIRAHQFHLIRSEAERLVPEVFRVNRDQLELELEALRSRKGELGVEAYLDQLEALMLKLARLYEAHGLLQQ